MALKSASKRKMHLFDGLIKPEKRALFYAACLITAIALYHQSGIADPQFVFVAALGGLGLWLLLYIVTNSALLIGFFCALSADSYNRNCGGLFADHDTSTAITG